MLITPNEWILKPDENGNGFLEATIADGSLDGAPIPIETHHVALEDVIIGAKQEFVFIFEGASDIRVYKDEEEFYKDKSNKLATEAYIPAGTFSPTGDENFVKSPRVIISGVITETYDDPTKYGFGKADLVFTMTCQGYEIDGIIHGELTSVKKLELGNIVSGIFWVQGWPKDK